MLPFKITKNSELGRFAIANQNFQPGDFLFEEIPFAVGPKMHSNCCCLECYLPLDATASGMRCEKCSWPLCDECSKLNELPTHRRECEVFSASKCKFYSLSEANEICIQLDCITPLRVLLEGEVNPQRWTDEIEPMEHHSNKRRGSEAWSADQQNIVAYLQEPCRLKEKFSEELIQKVIGILEVNAFEARTLNGNFVRCLYPKLAILTHSCTPNTTHLILPSEKFKLNVRTTVPVNAGTQLFSCYTYTLNSTMDRQQHLIEGKYFKCHCERCLDPTELGTNFSSLKCSECLFGDVNSSDPLNPNANWKCNKCSHECSASLVKEITKALQSEIECTENSVEFLEHSLEECEGILHPNHFIMIYLKNALIDSYGHVKGYLLSEMPDILLKRKIELCEELLKILDVFEKGKSRARALMMYELHAPLVLFAKSQYDISHITKLAYLEQLEKARAMLIDSKEVLEWEDENVCGIVKSARKSLENLSKLIETLSTTVE